MATIYGLVETAKLHGIDRETYLRRVLDCIAEHPVSRLVDLLPWNGEHLRPRLDQRLAA